MYNPQLLPGGKAVLLTVDTTGPVARNTIDVVTLADQQRKTVLRGAASARYLASPNGTGHLVYVTQATLFAISFDLNTLTTNGTAVPVVDDVAYDRVVGAGQFDVSRTGTLVYRRAIEGAAELRTLGWVDAEGKKEPLRARPANYQELTLSPDGRRVALSAIDGGSEDLWIYDPQRDSMTRLTSGGEAYRYPMWSPDGQHIVFGWAGHGMFQTRADGASQPLPLTPSTAAQYPSSFTSDGKRLAYHELAATRQLWTLPLQDEGGHLKAGTPEPFLKSGSTDVAPSFSPDGRWLAYQSDESGTNEVYVRAFSPASGSPPGAAGQGGVSTSLRTGKWQISNAGGTQPRWSLSGHDLIYQSGDQLMAARYTATGDTFAAERPRVWLAKLGAGRNLFGSAAWDLAPDGKRVIVAVPVEPSEAQKQEHQVVFLQNFVDELSRRVPLGK